MCRFFDRLMLLLVIVLAGCGGGGSGADSAGNLPPEGLLVGAHYYLWFPQKFFEGTLRDKLEPAQEPELGLYTSASRAVVEQHISWAAQHGVSFFTLLWSPKEPKFNAVITDTFLKARNIGDIKFCLFYGTGDIGSGFQQGVTDIDAQAKADFFSDLDYFAENIFPNPQYLRINNRPVLILYVTRILVGDYAAMLREARDRMRAKGVDLFLLADEVFWRVTEHREGPDSEPRPTTAPQTGRMELFDAVFPYNMYDSSFPSQSGYGGESTFFTDVAEVYKQYQNALPGGVRFVPYVMPGYNDRGVRAAVDHFPLPRELTAGAGETTFFRAFADHLVFPFVSSELPMVLITSWNEWSEDTAIEPLAEAPFTNRDQSNSGTKYTQGYNYSGFGLQYLEAVRDTFTAASGKVLSRKGEAAAGVLLKAYQDGHLVAETHSSSEGYFTFSNRAIRPGDLMIQADDGGFIKSASEIKLTAPQHGLLMTLNK